MFSCFAVLALLHFVVSADNSSDATVMLQSNAGLVIIPGVGDTGQGIRFSATIDEQVSIDGQGESISLLKGVDKSRWMEEIWPSISNANFFDLAFPATHDTLTFDLTSQLPANSDISGLNQNGIDWDLGNGAKFKLGLDEILNFFNKLGFRVVDGTLGKAFLPYAKNQEVSVVDQLNAGVRFFDLRVIASQDYDGADSFGATDWNMFGVHALQTDHDALNYLGRAKEWLEDHPKEFLSIFLTSHGNPRNGCGGPDGGQQYPEKNSPTPTTAQRFWNDVKQMFGSMLLDWKATPPHEKTMQQLLDSGSRVLIFAGGFCELEQGMTQEIYDCITKGNNRESTGVHAPINTVCADAPAKILAHPVSTMDNKECHQGYLPEGDFQGKVGNLNNMLNDLSGMDKKKAICKERGMILMYQAVSSSDIGIAIFSMAIESGMGSLVSNGIRVAETFDKKNDLWARLDLWSDFEWLTDPSKKLELLCGHYFGAIGIHPRYCPKDLMETVRMTNYYMQWPLSKAAEAAYDLPGALYVDGMTAGGGLDIGRNPTCQASCAADVFLSKCVEQGCHHFGPKGETCACNCAQLRSERLCRAEDCDIHRVPHQDRAGHTACHASCATEKVEEVCFKHGCGSIWHGHKCRPECAAKRREKQCVDNGCDFRKVTEGNGPCHASCGMEFQEKRCRDEGCDSAKVLGIHTEYPLVDQTILANLKKVSGSQSQISALESRIHQVSPNWGRQVWNDYPDAKMDSEPKCGVNVFNCGG